MDGDKKTPEVPHNPSHEGHIEPSLRPLRTFADDLSAQIEVEGETLSSIVIAERERQARALAVKPERTWRGLAFFLSSLGFVIIGVGAILGAYWWINQTEPAPPEAQIIFPNKTYRVEVPSFQRLPDALGAARTAATLSLGEVGAFRITLAGTTTAATILESLDAPSALVRETKRLMIGVHAFNRVQPFIIIEVGQFDLAYSAMLEWEEELGRSLGAFFRPSGTDPAPTTLFRDRVIKNVDARISQEAWPILFSFPRRDILIITTNEFTLNELLTRLNAQQPGAVLP